MCSLQKFRFPSSYMQSLFLFTIIFLYLNSTSASLLSLFDPPQPQQRAQSSSSAGIYTAISPRTIYPFSTYTIRIAVEPRSNIGSSTSLYRNIFQNQKNDTTLTITLDPSALEFQVEIQSEKENYTTKTLTAIRPGSKGMIEIPVRELSAEKCTLIIRIKSAVENHPATSQNTTIYVIHEPKPTILIHSDRSIYKPGDTVRFRVILLNSEGKPWTSSLNSTVSLDIFLRDPDYNDIAIINDAKLTMGLFSSKFQLPAKPYLGVWTIHVEQILELISPTTNKSEAETMSLTLEENTLDFRVNEYERSRFEVALKLPPYLLFDVPKVIVQVDAHYISGDGVKGECTLHADGTFRSFDPRTFPMDGTATMEFDMLELLVNQYYAGDYLYINFEASVTDNLTRELVSVSKTLNLCRYPYKIEFVERSHDNLIQRGLPFTVNFKILTHDNLPIHDPSPNAVQMVHVEPFVFQLRAYDQDRSKKMKNVIMLETSVAENGIASFTIPSSEFTQSRWEDPYIISVRYKQMQIEHELRQKHTKDDSDACIRIQVMHKNNIDSPSAWSNFDSGINNEQPAVNIDSLLMVNVISSEPFSSINYVLQNVQKQTILEFETIDVEQKQKFPVKEYNFTFFCPLEAYPKARIIVYTVLVKKIENDIETRHQVAAGSFEFTAKNPKLAVNYLNISVVGWDGKSTFELGQKISLKLETRSNSLVALRGFDQSLLMMPEKDSDITPDFVDREVANKSMETIETKTYFMGGRGSILRERFVQSVPLLLSNADTGNLWKPYTTTLNSYNKNKRRRFVRCPPGERAVEIPKVRIQTESEFPETWLWEEVTFNESNSVTIATTIPDTTVSWIITGYSLNSELGLGFLPQPKKLTARKPFSLSHNLPYSRSVAMGEVLIFQVFVHNYLSTASENEKLNSGGNTTVEITLDNSKNQFRFKDGPILDAREQRKVISCRPNSISSVSFSIVVLDFGSILINVKGVAQNPSLMMIAGDSLSQTLTVQPPDLDQFHFFFSKNDTKSGYLNSFFNMFSFLYSQTEGSFSPEGKLKLLKNCVWSFNCTLPFMERKNPLKSLFLKVFNANE